MSLKSIAECEGAVSYCKWYYRHVTEEGNKSHRCTHPSLPKKRKRRFDTVPGTILYKIGSCPLRGACPPLIREASS